VTELYLGGNDISSELEGEVEAVAKDVDGRRQARLPDTSDTDDGKAEEDSGDELLGDDALGAT
jgi:hypothetical protein